jgi:hypothetical protein
VIAAIGSSIISRRGFSGASSFNRLSSVFFGILLFAKEAKLPFAENICQLLSLDYPLESVCIHFLKFVCFFVSDS